MKLTTILFLLIVISCDSESEPPVIDTTDYTVEFNDGTISCPFGTLPYRVYYPKELTGPTFVIHLSRGGNGVSDDRGQLLAYVEGSA